MNKWQNSDKYFAILGLIFSVLLGLFLYWRGGSYIEMAGLLFLACAGYLVLRVTKRLPSTTRSSPINYLHKPSTFLIISFLFFVLFSYSMISVALRPELYSRPIEYFIAIAFMAAILGLQIFLFGLRKGPYTYFILFEIILLGINLHFIPQLLFPGVVGIDPWAHQSFTYNILELGHIPEGFSYSNLPIMHLIVGSTSLITGLDYPYAAMLSISLIQIIVLVLFTFLIGRLIGNPKAGLLGALALMMVPDVLSTGFYIIPSGFSLVWILMLIYLLFREKGKESLIVMSICLVLMGILILTHTITALAMSILLLCFWIGFKVYNRAEKVKYRVPVSFYLFSLFTVSMFSWWIYASGHISVFADLIKNGFRFEQWGHTIIETGYIGQIAYFEYLLNMLGFLLFYAIAVIGSLYLISPAFRNKYSFVIVFAGSLLLIIAALSLPLERTGFLTGRWFVFTQLILVIPFAYGLFCLSSFFRNRLASTGLFTILLLTISFLMITNSTTNFDSPIYAKNLTTRNALTASEQEGMDTISEMWQGTVAGVYPEIYYFRFNKDMPANEMAPCLLSKDFTDCQEDMIIVRKEILDNPIHSGQGIFQIDYDLLELLEDQGFSRVYDSTSLAAFLKPY